MMKIKNRLFIYTFIAVALLVKSCTSHQQQEVVDYVNPYMGNISHLLVPTFPTIHLPNSMLRVYPERSDYTGDLLQGLPLIVTSHRGSSAFNLSPYQGEVDGMKPVIPFSYDMEKITPYSYAVYLDEQQTDIEYAISHQAAIYKIGFNNAGPASLILNSRNGELRWANGAISGYQQLTSNTRVYIYLETDVTPNAFGVLTEEKLEMDASSAIGRNASIALQFPHDVNEINVRYGISFIDEEQARENLRREISGYDLQPVLDLGRQKWNDALGKIKVKGGSEEDKIVFYTSLYRTFERPVCISEDGRYYSAFSGTIQDDKGIPFYTDDWIWDSFRAHHPLNILIDPRKEENIIHSFIEMADQMDNFWMPTFPEITGDSRRMNSNHGVATVLDAWVKGLRGFDLTKAFQAGKGAITEKTLAPWSGKPGGELDKFYHEHGYMPALYEDEEETIPEVHSFERRQPVAVTLGTAYDEWCMAMMANELGYANDYQYFIERSFNYRHLFHPETHFFHPKDDKGEFIQPFDYRFSGGQGARGYYSENNAWMYRWDVKHNIQDLINLMGGNDFFISNLDAMFSEPLGRSKFAFYAQLPDHTGNVGQFSMGNEPAFHVPYLYNYAGQPWKAQKRIRTLIHQWFRNDLMGIPGDEDGGSMSAFVVFSQLGFYPVTPGLPMYNIGSPAFSEASIQLDNGHVFEIIAHNNSAENKYIQSAKLNGVNWEKPWFSHNDIINGGKLELVMGEKANRAWGALPENSPPSFNMN